MFILLIFSVLVQLCCVTNTKADEVPESSPLMLNIKKGDSQKFITSDNVQLNLRIIDSDKIDSIRCEGRCMVNNKKEKLFQSCYIITDKDYMYTDVSLIENINLEDSGEWKCDIGYISKVKDVNKSGQQGNEKAVQEIKTNRKCKFQLHVEDCTKYLQDWTYIVIGISILVILIIIGQTICIIYFRRKAATVKRQAEWTSRKELPADTVPPAPQPPSLHSLPHKEASHSITPVSTSNLVADKAESSKKSFTNGIMLPFNTRRKKKVPKEKENNAVTLDRLNERPPLPLPTDVVYEVMENSPTPPRKEIKQDFSLPKKPGAMKKEIPVPQTPKSEEFRGFNTHPRMLPASPAISVRETKTLKPQELSSQLRQAVHLRQHAIDVVQEPPRPKKLPPKIVPFNPGLPPTAAPPSRLASPFPRPENSIPGTSVVPKCKPPAPAKPKQLHPLPPVPTEPIPIPVVSQGDDENDWEEEWTYEPLPTYNIYSI